MFELVDLLFFVSDGCLALAEVTLETFDLLLDEVGIPFYLGEGLTEPVDFVQFRSCLGLFLLFVVDSQCEI